MEEIVNNSSTDEAEQQSINAALWNLLSPHTVGHGNTDKLAKKLGVSRQTLRHIEMGRGLPSAKTMGKIKKAFPNFSADAIYSGQMQGTSSQKPEPENATDEVEMYIEQLARQEAIINKQEAYINKLEMKVDRMEAQIETLNAQVVRLSELNFPGSSSHTTAKPNRRSRKRRQTTQESNHQIVPQAQNLWRNPIGYDQELVNRDMMPANEVKENSTLNLLRSYPGVSNAHCFSIQL